MAACCSRSVPAAMKCYCVLKHSWPRTSGTAMWASLIVAGPYFLAFLSGACHLVSNVLHNMQLDSNNSVDLPRGPVVVAYVCIAAWIFDSLNCWCIKILLHVNDLIQVIFAARFIWTQHSNMTTLLFHRKTCDLFFLKIIWFCLPWWFCYQVLICCNTIPPCVILFHVWN